jgi:hypothetical protein
VSRRLQPLLINCLPWVEIAFDTRVKGDDLTSRNVIPQRQSEEFDALARLHPDTEFQTASGARSASGTIAIKPLKFIIISWREYTARSTPVTHTYSPVSGR